MAKMSCEKEAVPRASSVEAINVLPASVVETMPKFEEFMEMEYNGDYSAARSAYMRKFRVDPTMMYPISIR